MGVLVAVVRFEVFVDMEGTPAAGSGLGRANHR
jgi:hypothetical protein